MAFAGTAGAATAGGGADPIMAAEPLRQVSSAASRSGRSRPAPDPTMATATPPTMAPGTATTRPPTMHQPPTGTTRTGPSTIGGLTTARPIIGGPTGGNPARPLMGTGTGAQARAPLGDVTSWAGRPPP